MVDIIPAILTNDPDELAEMLVTASVSRRVQIDIIDGEFADNKTVDPTALNDLITTSLLDFHLMVKEPIHWVEKCINAGGDRIIGHIEKMADQEKFVDFVHEKGASAGLAMNLGTKLHSLDWRILPKVEVVLVMSVPAGLGGQDFDKSVLELIAELAKLRSERSLQFAICDDGGSALENVDDVHFLGVNEVAVGRRLFEGNIAENIKKFSEKAHVLDNAK